MNPHLISGTVMVIGAVDRGKTTLARWLIWHLCQHHKRVGWLDGDVGESTLGLPVTMNLMRIEKISDQSPRPHTSFFVGATSSRKHMLPTLVGLHYLRDRALAEGATAVVIDTTAFVVKEAGEGALKQ